MNKKILMICILSFVSVAILFQAVSEGRASHAIGLVLGNGNSLDSNNNGILDKAENVEMYIIFNQDARGQPENTTYRSVTGRKICQCLVKSFQNCGECSWEHNGNGVNLYTLASEYQYNANPPTYNGGLCTCEFLCFLSPQGSTDCNGYPIPIITIS